MLVEAEGCLAVVVLHPGPPCCPLCSGGHQDIYALCLEVNIQVFQYSISFWNIRCGLGYIPLCFVVLITETTEIVGVVTG